MPWDFVGTWWPFHMILSGSAKVRRNHCDRASQRNSKENFIYFSVNTVPACGLSPQGARPHAGTMLSAFGSCVYAGLALQRYTMNNSLSMASCTNMRFHHKPLLDQTGYHTHDRTWGYTSQECQQSFERLYHFCEVPNESWKAMCLWSREWQI